MAQSEGPKPPIMKTLPPPAPRMKPKEAEVKSGEWRPTVKIKVETKWWQWIFVGSFVVCFRCMKKYAGTTLSRLDGETRILFCEACGRMELAERKKALMNGAPEVGEGETAQIDALLAGE